METRIGDATGDLPIKITVIEGRNDVRTRSRMAICDRGHVESGIYSATIFQFMAVDKAAGKGLHKVNLCVDRSR